MKQLTLVLLLLVLPLSVMAVQVVTPQAIGSTVSEVQVVTVYISVDCDEEIKKLEKELKVWDKKYKRLIKILKGAGKDIKKEVLK